MTLILPYPLFSQMLAASANAYPREACGLLFGHAGRILRCDLITNIAPSTTEFEMDPAEQVTAMLQAEQDGLTLAAIFHSHPDADPVPSTTDLTDWAYPQAAMLIMAISGTQRNRPRLAAYSVRDKQFTKISLTIL